MKIEPRSATLDFGGVTLKLVVDPNLASGYRPYLIDLKGWYGGVGVESDKTQRSLGHGLFPSVSRRSGRVLTMEGELYFDTEADRLVADRFVSALDWDARHGTLTVETGDLTLTSTVRLDGEVSHAYKGRNGIKLSLPLVAEDPFLYSLPRTYQVYPTGSGIGLRFPLGTDKNGGTKGVISFGKANPNTQALIQNRGNATAYPLIRVRGDLPSGFAITDDTGRRLEFPVPVWEQAPVEIDSGEGVILQGGVEQSWRATARTWFQIPAKGTASYRITSLQASTDGWAEIVHRDTYL